MFKCAESAPARRIENGLRDGEPLPLVAFEAPCLLRTVATETLGRAGLPWRMAFSSPSLGGIWRQWPQGWD
ncbi:hypothetical protein [Mesorhizobium sp. B2-4-17]|uniref:hypothetical protein n=1 Tax=Mesorhizobium sp. B2-4-17 TaxID=2589932 RepID=UPI001FEFE661|nr:hypothetical protein [Mesorhizobium sp. B2-4-17]